MSAWTEVVMRTPDEMQGLLSDALVEIQTETLERADKRLRAFVENAYSDSNPTTVALHAIMLEVVDHLKEETS